MINIFVHNININSNELTVDKIIISATSFYLEAILYVMHELKGHSQIVRMLTTPTHTLQQLLFFKFLSNEQSN